MLTFVQINNQIEYLIDQENNWPTNGFKPSLLIEQTINPLISSYVIDKGDWLLVPMVLLLNQLIDYRSQSSSTFHDRIFYLIDQLIERQLSINRDRLIY